MTHEPPGFVVHACGQQYYHPDYDGKYTDGDSLSCGACGKYDPDWNWLDLDQPTPDEVDRERLMTVLERIATALERMAGIEEK